MTTNLPSGYHRDLQLLKENLFPSLSSLSECLQMASFMLENIQIRDHILDDSKYDYLFSVEEVNRQVLQGVPFRDAYKNTGLAIEAGKFSPDKNLCHVHEGSIGNLCNTEIRAAFDRVYEAFRFEAVNTALAALID
jgi:argininosuccinate lyase